MTTSHLRAIVALACLSFVIPITVFAAFDRDLSYGARGAAVTELQTFLRDYGYYDGPITGGFYGMTQAAVIRFQRASGITPAAGYFGPRTRTQANVVRAAKAVGTQIAPSASAGQSVRDLRVSSTRTTTGVRTTLLFTVAVGAAPSLERETVLLERADLPNKAVATGTPMRDDGLGGDGKAGDGVYTTLYTYTPQVPGSISFRASAKYRDLAARAYSDTVSVIATASLSADQSLQALASSFNAWDLASARNGVLPSLSEEMGISGLSRANASRIGSCMATAKVVRDGSAFRVYACEYIGADGRVTPDREFSLSLQDDGRWLLVAW